MIHVNGLVNLTPHTINIVLEDGSKWLDVPVSGVVVRCEERRRALTPAEFPDQPDLPITEIEYGPVEGMPEPQPGITYIVSALVAARLPMRSDVLIPGPLKRDEKGQPIGCVGLCRYRPDPAEAAMAVWREASDYAKREAVVGDGGLVSRMMAAEGSWQ